MMTDDLSDTLQVEDEPKSAARIQMAIKKAERHFNGWQATCDMIDTVYARPDNDGLWIDNDYDLFWASTEVLKAAIYMRPPKPVVAPMFSDRRPLYVTTAEMLERTAFTAFDRGGMDEAMLCVRDDLIFYNRGQVRVVLDEQAICIDHVDRKDFLTPPARKWSELPWVSFRAWLTTDEFIERFPKVDEGTVENLPRCTTGEDYDQNEGKIPVWETWHKADNKVYWTAEGVEDILDEGKPHLTLRGFFPCPRPAYGTMKPRTLEPVPDYTRYVGHFKQINSITRRIYNLLDRVRMKGLIPAGGTVGDAIEQLMNDDSNASMLIPVEAAAIMNNPTGFVQWVPLDQLTAAIAGLVEARRELFADYDRLSGISDIMRGETEAQETLGAQRMKSQYGSIRVRGKIDELQRLARDVTQIAAEVMAEQFTQKTFLDMSQMEIPTSAELKKEVAAAQEAAEDETKEIGAQVKQAVEAQQIDPAQAQEQLQAGVQEIAARFGPILSKLEKTVAIDDVMKLLRDDRARGFAFEIETDSTILTDETVAKESANQFYATFTNGMQGLMGAASMGEEVLRATAEVFKMTLSPYRPPRSVTAAIDDMLDAAPQIAERVAAQQAQSSGDQEAMTQLAQAELQKAQAQTMKVEADTMKAQADAQLKAAELQGKQQEAEARFIAEQQRSQVEVAALQGKLGEQEAKINLMTAQTAEILSSIGLDVRKQDLEEYKTTADVQARQADLAMNERQQAMTAAQSVVESRRADRSESRADRQQQFAERQPPKGQ